MSADRNVISDFHRAFGVAPAQRGGISASGFPFAGRQGDLEKREPYDASHGSGSRASPSRNRPAGIPGFRSLCFLQAG
jgi:hypothetical protein